MHRVIVKKTKHVPVYVFFLISIEIIIKNIEFSLLVNTLKFSDNTISSIIFDFDEAEYIYGLRLKKY